MFPLPFPYLKPILLPSLLPLSIYFSIYYLLLLLLTLLGCIIQLPSLPGLLLIQFPFQSITFLLVLGPVGGLPQPNWPLVSLTGSICEHSTVSSQSLTSPKITAQSSNISIYQILWLLIFNAVIARKAFCTSSKEAPVLPNPCHQYIFQFLSLRSHSFYRTTRNSFYRNIIKCRDGSICRLPYSVLIAMHWNSTVIQARWGLLLVVKIYLHGLRILRY